MTDDALRQMMAAQAAQMPGSTPLNMARQMLKARAAAYKELGIPEEAADVEMDRRARIDEREQLLKQAAYLEQQSAAYQNHARHLEAQLGAGMANMRPLPPLPLDPFALEDLWISEGTEETFNEWYARRK